MKNYPTPGCGQCGYGHTTNAECECPCHFEGDSLVTPTTPLEKEEGK